MNFRKLYILSAFLLAAVVSACIRLGNDAQTVADSIAEAVESKDFNRLAEINEAFRASLADDVIRSAETPQQQEVFTTVNQRISSLKSSYKPSEFERMKNAFGRTLLSAGGDQWLTAFEF